MDGHAGRRAPLHGPRGAAAAAVPKLFGANANQPLVSGPYGITGPLVRPFEGIFPEPSGPPALDLAALLAVAFFFLIAALIVAVVRAITAKNLLEP